MVLERLEQHGLKLKQSKCVFMEPKVEFLGYQIDSTGLHTSSDKVDAVNKAPTPEGVTQLHSFLGLVNYYGRLIANLSTLCQPLNNLLRKNVPWEWTDSCKQAFEKVKRQLSSAKVLVHYDPSLPLSLACDATSYGVGAVISHSMQDGTDRPVAYSPVGHCQVLKNIIHN